MSMLSQFVGGNRPVKALTAEILSGPWVIPSSIGGARQGDVTCAVASTLYTVVSVSGAGALGFFSIRSKSTTSQAQRVKITLDGVVIYDQTGGASVTNLAGFIILGSVASDGATYRAITHKLSFTSSLLIEVSSSAAGESLRSHYIYEVY